MASTPNQANDMLIRKLEGYTQLSSEERQAIERLPMTVKLIGSHQDIVLLGGRPSSCTLMLDGWMCRYKMMSNGGRQIFSFNMPGDIPDLQGLYLHITDHFVRTLTSATVAHIPHDALLELIGSYSGIATALWRDTLIAASVSCERMVSIGRRSASEAVGHLLCEIFLKLQAVGLAKNGSYALPLAQHDIGDALGISSVHVNRVLKDLRKMSLIKTRGREVEIISWKHLSEFCDFDPGYLFLNDRSHEMRSEGQALPSPLVAVKH